MQIEYIEPEKTISAPLEWQKRGLSQTATGYGAKLATCEKALHNGRLYRIYAICYSNAASYYIISRGKKLFIR